MSCTFWMQRKKRAAMLKAQAANPAVEAVIEKPEEKAVADDDAKPVRKSKPRTTK